MVENSVMKFISTIFILLFLGHTAILSQIPDSCKLEIGTNLSGIEDFSRELPFANLMKMSREWYTKGENDPNFVWDTDKASLLSYDENGYPAHIPQILDGVELPQQVATVWDGMDSWPSGTYTLLWEGNGDFEFWGDYTNLVKVNDNRYEFDYENIEGGILQIIMTFSDATNPVNDMRLLLPGTEETYLEQPFNPDWLEALAPFKTLRFMDWGHTNFWAQPDPYTWDVPEFVDWDERTTADHYTYSGNKGVPYEYMIQLINELEIDAWLCVPHRASDDYISKMADMFRDGCDGERHLYVEYSNEIWNFIFGQTQWLIKYGSDETGVSWPEGTVPYIQNVFDLWTDSFNDEMHRLTRVAAVQTAWQDVSERMVYNLDPNTVDAVSPTFYFSFDESGDAILDDLGAEATISDVAEQTRLGMSETLGFIRDIKTISDSLDAQLVFYEGGQHMTPDPFGEFPSYDEALLAIHRDEEMYHLYNDWLDSLRVINTSDDPWLLMHFSFINKPSAEFGSWGLLETMNQDLESIPAPKYQSIIENIGCAENIVSSNLDSTSKEESIAIFPNPTCDEFHIKGLTLNAEISLIDNTGNLIREILPTINTLSIDLSQHPEGIYFIQIVVPESQNFLTEKIIKL